MGRSFAVGLKKGYPVHRFKQAKRHVKVSKRQAVVKDVVRELSGFAPYERHMIDLLRRGLDKKALKYAKAQLGTHKRGLAKREEIARVVEEMRQHAHHHEEHHEEHKEEKKA